MKPQVSHAFAQGDWLDETLTRLQREGKDWSAALAILQRTADSFYAEKNAHAFSADYRRPMRRRLDTINRNLFDATRRLKAYIADTTPPGLVGDAAVLSGGNGGTIAILDFGVGRVLRAVRELEAALTACPALSLPSQEINRLHPFRASRRGARSKKAIVDQARKDLRALGLDVRTISNLLSIAGLTKSPPPR